MLMEKMLRDFSWCPQLLTQEEEHTKRFVEEPPPSNYDWSSVREVITQSFKAGKPVSPQIFFRPLPNGGSFERYELDSYKNFWVLTRSQFEELLLGVNRIEVKKEDVYQLTVERRHEKGPFGERDQLVEKRIRQLIWNDCRRTFGKKISLTVKSIYDSSDQEHVTTELSHEENVNLERFLDHILSVFRNQIPPTPDYSKCGICRWQECPKRMNLDTRIFEDVGML